MMDGAMNTELSRKGFQFNTIEWLRVNSASPQPIAEIHADYARAGAELHIANSFATGLHVLEHFDLADEFVSLNRAAVDVCREAIDDAARHDQWIAGSISTFAHDHDRRNLPSGDVLERNVAEQANILADAGCDVIALEMLFDVETTVAMLKGAERCGLPVSVGLVCTVNANGTVGFGASRVAPDPKPGATLAGALPQILDASQAADKLIVTAMHTELEDSAPALEIIRQQWDGTMAVYPNTGHYKAPGGWDTSTGCTPGEFADACENWIEIGAGIVGGCCGIGPKHLQELGQRLNA